MKTIDFILDTYTPTVGFRMDDLTILRISPKVHFKDSWNSEPEYSETITVPVEDLDGILSGMLEDPLSDYAVVNWWPVFQKQLERYDRTRVTNKAFNSFRSSLEKYIAEQ